jgi:hypothetical protein
MSDIDLTPGAFALPEPIQPLDAPEATDEQKATQLPNPTGWKILCAVPDISERIDGTSLDLVRPIEGMRLEETATTVLFVLKVGPDAYNDTAKFPNGAWCKEGDLVYTGQEAIIEGAKSKADTELAMARRRLKEAQESFDTDAIIEAQEAVMDAKIRAEQVKNYRPTPLQEDNFEVQTQQAQPSRAEPDEKTLRWQAKNQWFGQQGFEEYTSYALGLHQKLVTNGVDPRSAEYFDQIDGRMKSTFPDLFGQANDKPRSGEVQKRPTTVVASVSRSTSAGKVKLTQTQVALAKKFGLTPQQYAVQVAKLEN